MNTAEKALILLFTLAIVAVIVANGQGAALIAASGQFLKAMVDKVNGPSTSSG